jgi:hypothetical protein
MELVADYRAVGARTCWAGYIYDLRTIPVLSGACGTTAPIQKPNLPRSLHQHILVHGSPLLGAVLHPGLLPGHFGVFASPSGCSNAAYYPRCDPRRRDCSYHTLKVWKVQSPSHGRVHHPHVGYGPICLPRPTPPMRSGSFS